MCCISAVERWISWLLELIRAVLKLEVFMSMVGIFVILRLQLLTFKHTNHLFLSPLTFKLFLTLVTFKYRDISNIRRTKSQNLNDSRLVLHLSLSNLLKPGVK